MFKSKRISLLTILALLIPTSAGFAGLGSSAANAATSLSTLTVNGQDVSGLTTYELDPYTTSVTVVATPSDPTATAVVSMNGIAGSSTVAKGNNLLSVAVTDAESTSTTNLYLVVPKGDKTDAVIVLNQEELINGETTEADWGTTSVPVVVTLSDSAATVKVNGVSLTKSGAVASGTVTGLETGDNLVDVVVTADDGVTTDESQLTVTVLKNTNAGATLAVDGLAVDDGETVTLDALTTDVDVQVYTADENATYELVGGTNLIPGENRVEIYVTAEDGVTIVRYDLTLVVSEDDDATLDSLKINGVVVSDGDTVELPYQTSSVNVGVFVNDPDASYVVDGGSDLIQGDNDLIVTVTAPDNKTVLKYTLNLHVGDPDVTLKTLKFNGANLSVDSTVETYSLTNTLELATTDSRAKFSIDGATFNAATGALTLEAGSNEITITVTGDDKATTADYTFTVLKAGFAVDFEGNNGDAVDVAAGSNVTVPANTASVTVDVTAPVAGSIVEVEGNRDLELGVNQVYVVITYPDLHVVTTNFTVTVLPASTALSTFTVNDDAVVLNGTTGTMTLDAGTTSVEVAVETVDENATYSIVGDNGLVLGNNVLTVRLVTSDGQVVLYTVTLIVPASTNAGFDAISINGVEYKDEDLVEVNAGVIDVQVDTQESHATVAITGAVTANTVGGNIAINNGVITASGYVSVTVVVTAQDGVTKSAPQVINFVASTDLGVTNGSNPSDDEIRVGTYAKVDSTLAKANFAPSLKLNYKWTVDGTAVANATTTRFLLAPSHKEAEVRPVVYGGTGSNLKTIVGKTVVVGLGIIKKAPTPSILGKSALGQNLKAITKVWSQDVDLTYKWYINYEDATSEAAATTEEFMLKADDVNVGDTITLGVTGTLDGYETVQKLSAPMTVTAGVIKITAKPTISADPGYVTGGTITVVPGTSNVEDAEATFVWTRNGAVISGATDAEYTLTAADFNTKLAVTVTFAMDGFSSASTTVKTPTIKAATLDEVDAPTITAAGNVLTANAGYSMDAPATSVRYIWTRNGRVITDAKSMTYTLKLKDKGTKIGVSVVGSYLGYKSTFTKTDEDGLYLVPKN